MSNLTVINVNFFSESAIIKLNFPRPSAGVETDALAVGSGEFSCFVRRLASERPDVSHFPRGGSKGLGTRSNAADSLPISRVPEERGWSGATAARGRVRRGREIRDCSLGGSSGGGRGCRCVGSALSRYGVDQRPNRIIRNRLINFRAIRGRRPPRKGRRGRNPPTRGRSGT